MCLDQENYINWIFKRIHTKIVKQFLPPLLKGLFKQNQATKDQEVIKDISKVPYTQAVVSLMYAMTSTRLEKCDAVGLVSSYQENPGKSIGKHLKTFLDTCK